MSDQLSNTDEDDDYPDEPTRALHQRHSSPAIPTVAGDWVEQAICAQTDPEAYFPEKGERAAMAKWICGQCEVRTECLDYAIENRLWYGVWGGTDPRERQAIARNRNRRSTKKAS